MTSLKSVMKIIKVLKILSLIAVICCFIGAACCIFASTVVFMLPNFADSSMLESVLSEYDVDLNFFKLGLIVVCAALMCVAQAITLLLTYIYLKNVENAGTPFTQGGAHELCRLGILAIVVPLVAVIVASMICTIFGTSGEFSITTDIGMGIGMILLSRFFRYGAELEDKLREKEAQIESINA